MTDEYREADRVPVHRRPRMVPFLATGALLGLVAGIVLTLYGPQAPRSGTAQELILLGGAGALFGGLLGAIAFLLVERLAR